MLDYLCSTCGKRSQAAEPIVCPDCNRTMTAVTAIATPEDAASTKLTMPADARTAFSEGLPPLEPAPSFSITKEPASILSRCLNYLVVAAVVLTLVALFVPSVERVREAAARTQSTNNLKQIGLAAHSFDDMNKRLPFNGSSVAVKDEAYFLNAVASRFTSGSWAFQISSFMDQGPMFHAGASDTGVAALMCPGRGRPSTLVAGAKTPPWSDYVINPWINDPKGGGGITTTSAVKDNCTKLVDITDGTSNTIFFGHGQINTDDYKSTIAVPSYIDTVLVGGTTATALSSNPAAGPVTFAADSANTRRDAARGWGSPFRQGCLLCMGDAVVRMFPYSLGVGSFANGVGVPDTSLAAFLTPAGKEDVVLGDP